MTTNDKIADILEMPAAYSHTDIVEAMLVIAAEHNRMAGRCESLESMLTQAKATVRDLEAENRRLRKAARSQAAPLCPKCGEPNQTGY